jgi:DtxR family Mn-dependent transcriptional regulator
MISVADQDYIKVIYKLQQSSGDVTTSALAKELGITAASVSGMLKKLSNAKLVTHRHYRGVRLTTRGERSAKIVMRRHRLIELFLVKVLGMSWDMVHQEAEVLEHAVSDEVIVRMDEMLGFPQRDPHGSPIPSSTGELAPQTTVRLDQIESGSQGVVSEITDDDAGLLRHLSKLGLVPGTRIRVNQVLAIDGTRVLQRGKKEISVSPKVASAIRVFLEK